MDAASPTDFWKKCSVCKKPIGFRAPYYVCSVSSCNGLRTGYAFCKVDCFESHIPGARHKSAGAIEKMSPSAAEARLEASANASAQPIAAAVTASVAGSVPSSVASSADRSPQRVIARPSNSAAASSNTSKQMPREVLVIASRLKEYITARSEYNTSQSVMDVLSDHLRIVCDRAIEEARADGRKTVMDRDFSFLKNTK